MNKKEEMKKSTDVKLKPRALYTNNSKKNQMNK